MAFFFDSHTFSFMKIAYKNALAEPLELFVHYCSCIAAY